MRAIGVALGALALASCATGARTPPPAAQVAPQEAAKLRQVGAAVLFWSQEERFRNFPAMEKIFPGTTAKAGRKVRALPKGAPLPIAEADISGFMAAQNVAGLLVLQDGKVRLERYAHGYGAEGALDQFLGRQVGYLNPGRCRDQGRLYQVDRRSGDALHPRSGGRGL
ncbi:hypothetical protein [Sphingomonas sp. J315]|uniref:hypothetical protein n=1 Tax=Sphingomonas sp. J315 TaxID=2898433 RepID=UPI0021AD8379|nr:hypothetical protein [Sphingomonas sp. J315]UUX99742.1 hypothetical protein LRS08_00775 [Sphingomonas sp. J315]